MKIKNKKITLIIVILIIVTPNSSAKDQYWTFSTELNVGDVFIWKVNKLVDNGTTITEPTNVRSGNSYLNILFEGAVFELEIIKAVSDFDPSNVENYDPFEYFQINLDNDSLIDYWLIRYVVHKVNYYDGNLEGNYFEIIANDEDSYMRPKNATIYINEDEYIEIRDSEYGKMERKIDWKLGITNYHYLELFDIGMIFSFERIIQSNEESIPKMLDVLNFWQTLPVLILFVFFKNLNMSKYK